MKGAANMALFNTVVTPNSQVYPWSWCTDWPDGTNEIEISWPRAAFATISGGVNVLLADGSVRFIKNSISQATWFALGTRANGEVISSNSY